MDRHPASNDPDAFIMTPYRCLLGVLIHSYLRLQPGMTVKLKARFARFIMSEIQSVDQSFEAVKTSLTRHGLTVIKQKAEEKLSSIEVQGVGGLIDLMAGLKGLADSAGIHKSSIIGLFIRRLEVYMDKMAFTSLTLLFQQFKEYISAQEFKSKKTICQTEPDATAASVGNLCPKQVSLLINQQITLLSVNEKMASNPKEIDGFIESIHDNKKPDRILYQLQRQQALMTASLANKQMNQLSHMLSRADFLRFLNCLRVKDFSGCQDALVSYFDNSLTSSCCWSVYNLARLHYFFGHDDLCLDAIKECIFFAQEVNDEACLDFCLLLLAKLMMRRRQNDASKHELDEDIVALLTHLAEKGLSNDLANLSVLSGLHLEQISPASASNQSRSKNQNLNPEILSVKHSLNELLGMVYSNRAADYSFAGDGSLNNLCSQVLLHINSVSFLGKDYVHFIDENTGIALRNIANYVWMTTGDDEISISLMKQLCQNLYSFYSDTNYIWKQSVAEIEFRSCLFRNKWKEAKAALDRIAVYDRDQYNLNKIELFIEMGNLEDAFELTKTLESTAKSRSHNSFFSLKLMLLRAKILKDVSLAVECFGFADDNDMLGLALQCLLLLASLLKDKKMFVKAFATLRNITLCTLSHGSLQDIASLCQLYANLEALRPDQESKKSAIDYCFIAIDCYSRLKDERRLTECRKDYLIFQALHHNSLGNKEERNSFARQLRLLSNESDNNRVS